MKVMVVDDNLTDLNGICTFVPWEKLGCTLVASARNGEDGVRCAIETKPDLIITDISMPKMDGMEMCSEIRKELPDVKLIFLSCLEDFEYAKEAINFRSCAYITKPIIIDRVIESILRVKETHNNEIQKQLVMFNLQKQLDKNMPNLIKCFFRDIFFGTSPKQSILTRQAQELNISLSDKYRLILFELNHIGVDISSSVQHLSNLIQSILAESFSCWSIDYKHNAFAVVLKQPGNDEDLVNCLNDIQKQMEAVTFETPTICIGSTDIAISSLHNEFVRLNQLLDSSLFYISQRIVYADELQKPDSYSQEIIFSQLDKDISVALSLDNSDVTEALIQKYFTSSNEVQLKSTACYMIVNLNMMLYNMSINIYDDNSKYTVENIMKCKTTEELRHLVHDIFNHARSRLSSNKSTASSRIVSEVKRVIANDFAAIATIEDITDNLHYNLLYANRVFKQMTGKTIYEYLVDFRIEKAKQLLSETDLKVYEIGEAVGYKTPKYFSMVFKNYTGMTPKQYRSRQG